MIPVQLSIKGLYSYQQEQIIDFQPLISGQLFGIFGSVGSGKSSILEAISFALYGETERLNQRDSRNYNMMNLKSDELHIDFEFDNFDQQRYRFTVKGKRHGKDFSQVNTFRRAAYVWHNAGWKPLEVDTAESILGLSYKNFHRTIIIPQGKFQEFLQLGESERTKMLKEIFQLEKFEFYQQTSLLDKENSDQLLFLQGQMQQFTHVSSEAISEKDELLKNLESEWQKRKPGHDNLERKCTELSELKKMLDQVDMYQNQVDSLLLQEPHFLHTADQIRIHEFCIREFRSELQLKTALSEEIQTLENQSKSVRRELELTIHAVKDLEQKIIALKPEIVLEESRKQQILDLKILIQIRQVHLELKALQEREKKGKEILDLSKKDQNLLSDELNGLKSQLKNLQLVRPDLMILGKAKEWIIVYNNLERKLTELQSDQQNILGFKQNTQTQMNSLMSQTEMHLLKKPEDWKSFLNIIPETISCLKVSQENLLQELQHCQLQNKLGEFSSELHEGNPCPLCGSVHHPEILIVQNVAQKLKDLEARKIELENQNRALEKADKDAQKLELSSQNIEREYESLQNKIDNALSEKKTHATGFEWDPSYRDLSWINKEIERDHQLQKNTNELQISIEKSEKNVSRLQQDSEKYQAALSLINIEISRKSSEMETLQKQIKLLNPAEYQKQAEADLEHDYQKLQAAVLEVRSKFDQCQTDLQQKKLDQTRLEVNDETLRKQWAQKQEELDTHSRHLEQKLTESEFSDWDIVKSILNNPIDIAKLKTELERFNLNLHTSKVRLEEIKKLTSGKQIDTSEWENSLIELEESKKQLQELHDQKVKESAALETLKNQLQHKLSLEKQISTLSLRGSNLSLLKQLFKGSGFVSYISSVYLQNLCHAANERFYKLSRQQLRLEINDRNEFQVRDFLHDGHLRSVKTLSGGQTFQASLSLALALAESVQQQSQASQNFFFLDEGFGSLDKDSLQLAFETLKSLRKENRIVGIISHVEDLQQEIDVFLSVKNDPAQGSLVRGNW